MTGFLPYGRQEVTDDDVTAVVKALRDPLITQGPRIADFESSFARAIGARNAVAFSSGTAALHGAAVAAGIRAGDHVVTTPISFVASSNCVLFAGGRPVFHDIDLCSANLDVRGVAESLSAGGARACIAVSLAGLPIDLEPLQRLRANGILVIEDACHALGGMRAGRPVGGDGLADLTVFSLHPVKAITSGEGGVVTTESDEFADRLRTFRTHGIRRDGNGGDDELKGGWHYDVASLGFNYRITDFQCALAESQLQRLGAYVDERNRVADLYRQALSGLEGVVLPEAAPENWLHAYHLFVVRFSEGAARRRMVYEGLREAGIGTQLHYIPIYRHSLYRSLGYADDEKRCPNAERYYRDALSLPIFPAMTAADVERVAVEIQRLLAIPLEP